MEIIRRDQQESLPDEWWAEAGMQTFKATAKTYRATAIGQSVFDVPTADIRPVYRTLSLGVFNDSAERQIGARERGVEILKGFRDNHAIPPVEVLLEPPDNPFWYRLKDGAHRFYLSIAAGFTHVPCVLGFDADT